MPTEEERAATFRSSLLARSRARVARWRALAGNPTAAQAVRDTWQPLIDASIDQAQQNTPAGQPCRRDEPTV